MTRDAVEARVRPANAPDCGVNGWSYGDLNVLGVAAVRYEVGGSRWFHAGLLYRRKGEVQLFEMSTHKSVAERKAPPGFVWVEPALSQERLRLVITRARLVREVSEANGVPYGFGFRRSAFDEKGIYRSAEGEVGLTCSTIIAAILEAEKIKIVDPDQWPAPDEEDKRERRGVIADIARSDPEHARVLTDEINAPRVRPQEVVAAAATFQDRVGTFENLQDGAVVVADRTVPVAPPPRPPAPPGAPGRPAVPPPAAPPPAG